MATKSESNFRAKVRRDLYALQKQYPFWYEAIQQRAIRGSPDFVLCANGLFVGLELKSLTGKVKPKGIQATKLNAINDANGLGLVANPKNWQTVLETIKFYLKGDNDDDQ